MYVFTKRLFDFIVSLILIILLSPVLLAIIIWLIAFRHTEILYLQERIGYRNKKFKIIKFSTMLRNAEFMTGGTITVRNDPRVTRIGKFLRRTKFNELPQLFNILIGTMSFVGPRPLVDEGFEMYTDEVKQKVYLSKPGLTGISSLLFRDEEKWVSETEMDPKDFYRYKIFPYKGELELWYYNNRSFGVDIMIIFLTALKVIRPKLSIEKKVFKDLPVHDFFLN